jgi:hypothetical protein
MDHPGGLACIVCRRGIASPGALLFYTRGRGDSLIFSPYPGRADYEHLRISVCDDCLTAAGEARAVEHGILQAKIGHPLPGEWMYRTWKLPRPGEKGGGREFDD